MSELNINKEELYKFYIEQQMTSKEVAEIFKCTSKTIRNYLKKYQIPIRPNGEAVKLERSKWTKEKEFNRSKQFSQTWNAKSKEDKERIMSIAHSYCNTIEAKEKSRKTKNQINKTKRIYAKLSKSTYTKSKIEDEYYKKLLYIFDEDDIIRQYKDERYPFSCDFYIKSKDLFIEIQYHYTHSIAPYDCSNKLHQELLERMKEKGINTKI